MMDMPHLSWQISCLLKNSLIDFKQLKTHHALRIIIIVNFNQGKPKYVYIMEVLLTYINYPRQMNPEATKLSII